MKVCLFDREEMRYPEYESVRKLAGEQGMAYREMYRLIFQQVNERL